ncbi:MAG: 50S ribosomal protein L15 [Omnitrophica WOR_2 bacterium GWF2_38_59]|nr:MAG: 50S ribosomal protein L15 [Omnitrophica WOR_2 bacterium GWF2_38_59]OGX47897.1 MAG: 50S ribosomal protein L15 [Omnitrophica WOR_2 bacterium RIFOXYA2_FULL_38_17]OGX54151.1 MAG: 50S ribosomal protein L15 [Omnitrophica WOR_2 bacterium RIFOXYA12_FULL_38_10]OGX56234.1 MAG: 50S ribosomal protein L15 [Omnitrophica WOR_2 bacterium RIFOXYC2_FULL_38_12]OGX60261.1 MAG: 50S ribosomal protein L15 [Omnitrophica WOR_2 bacterium RIFOXYB2_FULL_38_16]HBG61005.1 50S ribosomal protein L15 [Candidatus Omnit
MQLHELKSPKGSRKKKRIIGRGKGSGRGKTSGRGENGQRSRSGRWSLSSSEGGQMPLIRRLPKVGFRSKRPILNQVVSLESLNRFAKDAVVDANSLKAQGLINSRYKPVKILDNGEINKPLVIKIKSISKSAKEKIEKAGGKIEVEEKVSQKEKKTPKKQI